MGLYFLGDKMGSDLVSDSMTVKEAIQVGIVFLILCFSLWNVLEYLVWKESWWRYELRRYERRIKHAKKS
jgi:hypothetical protein